MTLFYLFGAVAVVASLLVIAQRNPIYSVLLLVASFGALSGLYVLLEAPFVAAIQIIIYAGAIMVLFLFVVMLLNAPQEDTEYDVQTHPLLRPGPMRFGAVAGGRVRRRTGLGADARPREVRCARRRIGELGRRHRPHPVHRLCVSLRGDLGAHPGGDGGRRRARPREPRPER